MKKILLILLTLLTAMAAWASTFTVTNDGNTFTITRNGSGNETVYYRTVCLSAMAGENFTEKTGSLTFTDSETQKTVTINEIDPSTYLDPDHDTYNLLYIIQTTLGRSYRFEVLNGYGNILASTDRDMQDNHSKYYRMPTGCSNTRVEDLAYFDDNGNLLSGTGDKYVDIGAKEITGYPNSSGWRKVTDDGYGQGYCKLSTDLFNGAYVSRAYADQQGMKLYATLIFKQKEDDDGYQYIQILGNNKDNYDGNDPDAGVNDPSISIYKACFELSKSGVTTSEHYQFFPHRYDYVNKEAEEGAHLSHYSFDHNNSYLWQQKFVSNEYRPNSSGSIILSPRDAFIYVRFDAAGNYDDDWYFADLKLRLALADAIKPTVVNNYKVNGGRHSKTNPIYVSVPFSEIVTVDGAPKLYTTWGELNYLAGSGSNVLTFAGTISNSASGKFTVNSYGGGTIADLAGNLLTDEISHAFGINLDINTYYISYDLDGGHMQSGQSNPTSYTDASAAITLNQPVRDGYTFKGWTGSNGNTPQLNVTIPAGTVGNLSYTANWELVTYNINYNLNGGSLPAGQSNPTTYTIETPTFTLNNPTKPGFDFEGWTGSNGSTPQTTVSVSQGHWGDISYTANWRISRYTFDSSTGALSLNWGEFNSGNKWGSEVIADNVTSVTATSQVSFTGDCSELFKGFTYCTSMNLNSVNTSNVTNMSSMFNGCSSLPSLNISSWNTANVTSMNQMFQNCGSLPSLNISSWNTANVTSMSQMFQNCGSLFSLNISSWNTANVTSMSQMFQNCRNLISLDLSSWNTAAVTHMNNMFYNCTSLSSLDLSRFNTENVSDMSGMFRSCSSLTSLDLSGFNTENVSDMSAMFRNCSSLTSLDLSGFNTENVSDMSAMFYNCSALTTIYAGTGWSTESVTDSENMFAGCIALAGGMGTTYDENHVDIEYARIDGGPSCPGYFTDANPTVVVPGDANGDGTVDVNDVTTTINYILGKNPSPFSYDNANVNGDDTVNVMDVTLIINLILGIG